MVEKMLYVTRALTVLLSINFVALNFSSICLAFDKTPKNFADDEHQHSSVASVENSPVLRYPLFDIEQLEYKGGFRTTGRFHQKEKGNSLNYSGGVFTYNAKNHSIFIIGHPEYAAVAEVKIPPLVKSSSVSDFNVANQLIQSFTRFHKTKRVDTGIPNHFRVTGLELVGKGLMVNYIDWYDAGGKETDTTVFFDDASDLAHSIINGPYQLQGAAHSAGWISKIPTEWQKLLGGTYISGSQPNASIISRRSVGPSAYIVTPEETILQQGQGEVPANGLLDFPLSNLLYDKSAYPGKIYPDDILRNDNGKNKMWTFLSGAGYGFIIPGTSTYMTIGRSGGHKTGVGYKIKQDDGRLCGGYCAFSATDYSSYYWLWDINQLLKVKSGLIKPYDVRPYDYGEFSTPFTDKRSMVGGAAYDESSGLLYLSFPGADKLNKYLRPPVILVYELTSGVKK
tara:strand:+ start:625 stop:1983 length:1359 start_codon:yes stop_codon:yes gene_type:complete